MITDPKVGDVVFFSEDGGWEHSFNISGEQRYVITRLPKPHPEKDGDHVPVRLRNIKTGKAKFDYQQETGVWTDWLSRDEFLSAAHHAQKERKRAPRTKTAA